MFVTAQDVKDRVARGEVCLLDVRTPGEFESTWIAGAHNVPLDQLETHAADLATRGLPPVVVVCQSGQRARRALGVLQQAGLTSAVVLEGGVNAWTAAGLPVERGRERMSLERQVRIVAGALSAIGAILALLVDVRFAFLPAFIGSGLVFAGVTNTCGMAMVLAKLPYNRGAACDAGAVIRAMPGAPAHAGR